MCSGRPVQWLHAWLIRARANPPLLSAHKSSNFEEQEGAFFLPTHLPACPVPEAAPQGKRTRCRWNAERCAWEMTEWMIAFYNYYDMGCAK
eukprot:3896741-Heterocapsa_arctica.AAC.1